MPRIFGRAAAQPVSRVRPGDPAWPSVALWDRLKRDVGGRLIEIRSPFGVCRDDPVGLPCDELFGELKNPYYVGDNPALTQTAGWVDAWTAQPSVYAVAAETAADVAAAVNFARDNNLRLVVKGGGHSYLGTSNAPDSLLVWTRRMNAITPHDSFTPQGCAVALPAVSVGAGAVWMHVYNEVTTRNGRYVQGGGCLTVGVAGLVQGGGYGSFSRQYGTAAANLLEAEIVTADGAVRIANACINPDLFWALKGGGGGTFGVVTRLTQRTTNRMLHGGVCGILGFGNVGVATARLMRAFGMKIHAINRRGTSHEPSDWIASTDLLDEMLRVADVLVISAALTTATEGLIGARELGLMKENAILINVARGEIIDEGALYAHLISHPHFFAGIDAWWVEPVRHGHFAMGYPFLDLPNVIGSPHNSAGGGSWRDEYLRRAVQNCRRAILGETPWNLIGPDERML